MALRANRNITAKEFKRILVANGFEYVSTTGSHAKYRRGNKTVIVNKNLNCMVALRLCKENNLVF